MRVPKTTRTVSELSTDTIEFRASKQHFQNAVTFLQQACNARLSNKEARAWALQIARIFPDSRLAATISEQPKVLTPKQRRLAKRKQNILNQQTEMLFLFTFRE